MTSVSINVYIDELDDKLINTTINTSKHVIAQSKRSLMI